MNNIQKLLNSPEIQEKLHIKTKDLKLNEQQKQMLGNTYLKLYFGMSCANWSDKKTKLGTAWQKAFDQTKQFIDSKNQDSDTVKFLNAMHEEHKTRWSKQIMLHQQRDSVIAGDEQTIQQWQQYATANIKSAMAELTQLMAKCSFTTEQEKGQDQKKTMGQAAKSAQSQEQKRTTVNPDNKHEVPLTKNDKELAGKPGVNSPEAKQEQTGVNSSQTTVRDAKPDFELHPEEQKKQAQEKAQAFQKGVQKIQSGQKHEPEKTKQQYNVAQLIRIQMMMHANQKAA